MDDNKIVELFWQRDEAAIAETECRYGSFCLNVAMSLLSDGEDARECVNEALYQAWNRIPPQRPEKLRPWLGRVVRNIAVSLWRKNHRQKRYNGLEQALHELEDCVPAAVDLQQDVEGAELGEAGGWRHSPRRTGCCLCGVTGMISRCMSWPGSWEYRQRSLPRGCTD